MCEAGWFTPKNLLYVMMMTMMMVSCQHASVIITIMVNNIIMIMSLKYIYN